MINEMLISGMLLLGTVDHVLETQVRIEYALNGQYIWVDIPIEVSSCIPEEGSIVLFSKNNIEACFCGGKIVTKRD